jgi:branched-chain amino acid transport system substrate-binding protein
MLRILTLLLASGLAMSACGRDSSTTESGDSKSIVVAATFPQSGPLAVTGAAGRGVKAAIDEANANGGIAGQEITWVDYDDAYDPARMIANARKAVQQDQADVLVSFGGPSLAIRPFANESKVFNLVLAGNTPFSDEKGFPYTHGAFPDLAWESTVAARELAKKNPDAVVGVLGFNNDLTDSQVGGLTAGGYEPDLVLKVPPTQQDVTSQITHMKEAGVDTVFLSVGPGQIIGAVKYMRAVDYSPTVVVYSLASGKTDAIAALGPDAANIYTARWIADPADPLWAEESDVAQFKEAIADSGEESDTDNLLALMGYVSGKALVTALENAEAGDGEDINAAWKSIKDVAAPGLPPGATLTYGAGGRLQHTYQLVQWDGAAWQTQGDLVDVEEAGLAN